MCVELLQGVIQTFFFMFVCSFDEDFTQCVSQNRIRDVSDIRMMLNKLSPSLQSLRLSLQQMMSMNSTDGAGVVQKKESRQLLLN